MISAIGPPVALDRASTVDHHLTELGLGDARHRSADGLHAQPVIGRDLERVVDVPAQLEHPQPVALEHRLLLLGRQPEGVHVGGLVGPESLAPGLGVERHAELVQRVALARSPTVEHVGPRYVVVLPGLGHYTIASHDLILAPGPTAVDIGGPIKSDIWLGRSPERQSAAASASILSPLVARQIPRGSAR
jgi:hypothetical protein